MYRPQELPHARAAPLQRIVEVGHDLLVGEREQHQTEVVEFGRSAAVLVAERGQLRLKRGKIMRPASQQKPVVSAYDAVAATRAEPQYLVEEIHLPPAGKVYQGFVQPIENPHRRALARPLQQLLNMARGLFPRGKRLSS